MYSWMVGLKPGPRNGLKKESSADAAQVKSFSTERFIKKLGVLSQRRSS
jgi:mRNA interferase MazF